MLRGSYNDYCDAKEEKIRLDKKNEDMRKTLILSHFHIGL